MQHLLVTVDVIVYCSGTMTLEQTGCIAFSTITQHHLLVIVSLILSSYPQLNVHHTSLMQDARQYCNNTDSTA